MDVRRGRREDHPDLGRGHGGGRGRAARRSSTTTTAAVDIQATCDGKKAATFTYDLAVGLPKPVTGSAVHRHRPDFAGDAVLTKKGVWFISGAARSVTSSGQNPNTPGLGAEVPRRQSASWTVRAVRDCVARPAWRPHSGSSQSCWWPVRFCAPATAASGPTRCPRRRDARQITDAVLHAVQPQSIHGHRRRRRARGAGSPGLGSWRCARSSTLGSLDPRRQLDDDGVSDIRAPARIAAGSTSISCSRAFPFPT